MSTLQTTAGGPARWPRFLLPVLGALVLWFVLYCALQPAATYFSRNLLRLDPRMHLGSAVEFFVYETPKVLMLLTLVVFGVGVVRSFFTPERTRAILAGRAESVGNVFAAGLGIVTPFCSCSAVPLFIGFLTAGVPLGVTFSFLIAAPMVNEVALALLFGLFGWKVARVLPRHRTPDRDRRRLGDRAAPARAARRTVGVCAARGIDWPGHGGAELG